MGENNWKKWRKQWKCFINTKYIIFLVKKFYVESWDSETVSVIVIQVETSP